MDKLTLIAVAQATPDAALVDRDYDYWHAGCALRWLEDRRYENYTELLESLRMVDDAPRPCLGCTEYIVKPGAIWMP